MFNNVYKDKKVLLTGHTGFKGSWLSLWLTKLGAKVCGYSLEPNTTPSMFDSLNIEDNIYQSHFGDILDIEKLRKIIIDFQPDIIFHLAAQPLVRLSYSEPLLTYKTNVIGTLNILEVAKNCDSVKAFVNVTTDKCYENKEINKGYKEDAPMGGYDMYSSSKGCVEIMSSSFRRSFLQDENSMAMATARAGNVIGGGDWAKDRLIPDCIRSINQNIDIEIRNPIAVRPWQHVLEPLSGYLLLGQKLLEEGHKYAEGFNFGPNEENAIVAPMIETPYAMKKYVKATHFVFPEEERKEVKFLINTETITGFNNLSDIIATPEFSEIAGIVLGRVDMTGSMGLTRDDINSDRIFNIAHTMSEKMMNVNKDLVIGGGVSAHSLPFFKKLPYLSRFETRKIIFDAKSSLNDKDADKGILKAVGFELMWLKNKREFYGMIFKEDEARLTMLEARYKKLIEEAGGVYA